MNIKLFIILKNNKELLDRKGSTNQIKCKSNKQKKNGMKNLKQFSKNRKLIFSIKTLVTDLKKKKPLRLEKKQVRN